MEGQRTEDIAAAFAKAFPKANYHKTMTAAMDHFELVAQAAPDTLRGWCLEAYREMYRRMVDIGDYAGALRAIKELMHYARTN